MNPTDPERAWWVGTLPSHVQLDRPLTVLDLGSGVGRFSVTHAETFGGRVYGVEPNDYRRGIARHKATHPALTYLDGAAEDIPLPDAVCDVVHLFRVWWQIDDKRRAVTEITRVLRPGGRVLIVDKFRDRMRYPDQKYPRVNETIELFASAGLTKLTVEPARRLFAGEPYPGHVLVLVSTTAGDGVTCHSAAERVV